jgi:hypothetical protein
LAYAKAMKNLFKKKLKAPPVEDITYESFIKEGQARLKEQLERGQTVIEYVGPESSPEEVVLFDNFPPSYRVRHAVNNMLVGDIVAYYEGLILDEDYPVLPKEAWEYITLERADRPVFQSLPNGPKYEVIRTLTPDLRRMVAAFIVKAINTLNSANVDLDSNSSKPLVEVIFDERCPCI